MIANAALSVGYIQILYGYLTNDFRYGEVFASSATGNEVSITVFPLMNMAWVGVLSMCSGIIVPIIVALPQTKKLNETRTTILFLYIIFIIAM